MYTCTTMYMYMTILYINKIHKIKTDRGVEITRKRDGQTDGRTNRQDRHDVGDHNIPDFLRKCKDN